MSNWIFWDNHLVNTDCITHIRKEDYSLKTNTYSIYFGLKNGRDYEAFYKTDEIRNYYFELIKNLIISQ